MTVVSSILWFLYVWFKGSLTDIAFVELNPGQRLLLRVNFVKQFLINLNYKATCHMVCSEMAQIRVSGV